MIFLHFLQLYDKIFSSVACPTRNPLNEAELRWRTLLDAVELHDGRTSREIREFIAIMTSTHMQVSLNNKFYRYLI